jgi:hypothetical protein
MMCIKPNVLATDLELVMECTMNSFAKQCVMRFPEVYLGEIMCVKPHGLAKDLELVMECTPNGYLKQCMMRFFRGFFRTNCEELVMSEAFDEMNNTTSTIKHREPLAMGVPLWIVSTHQGTQNKKRYIQLKSKAKTAKRQKEKSKAL